MTWEPSRIDLISLNGATGEHYEQIKAEQLNPFQPQERPPNVVPVLREGDTQYLDTDVPRSS